MVGGLLTLLVLSVIQLGVTLHVRNMVLDAATQGAQYAALADNGLGDGAARAREVITVALGPDYATGIDAVYGSYLGRRSAIVTVTTPLPVIGLLGIDHGLEVSGHAPVETLP
ncbi:hypothetical protein BH09ACT1_BH09ACT1_06520 [soil metagenome]